MVSFISLLKVHDVPDPDGKGPLDGKYRTLMGFNFNAELVIGRYFLLGAENAGVVADVSEVNSYAELLIGFKQGIAIIGADSFA